MKLSTSILTVIGSFLMIMGTAICGLTYERTEVIDEEDGTVYVWETYDDNSRWVWAYYKDGRIVGGEFDSADPDSGTSGSRPTADDIKDLARRAYQGKLSKGVQTNNPFVIKQSARGKGLAPRWNPPGRQFNGIDGTGGSGPGSNGGGTSEWFKSMAKKGGSDDDTNESGKGPGKRPELGTNGSVRPERVNPVPFLNQQLRHASAFRSLGQPAHTIGTSTTKTQIGATTQIASPLPKTASLKKTRTAAQAVKSSTHNNSVMAHKEAQNQSGKLNVKTVAVGPTEKRVAVAAQQILRK
ncbi:MAG: hypothetical protein IH612_02905 [Desulfofustis sp.]|nr:hypothetical protein [Desulfofustis sp.]